MQFAPSSQTSSGPEQTQEPPGVRRPRACWSSRPPLPAAHRGQRLASGQFRRLLLLTLAAAPLYWVTEHLSREWTRPGREETLSVRHVWGPEDFDSNNGGDAAGSSRGSHGPPPSVCSEAGEGASAPCERGVSSVPDARLLRVLHSECTEQARDVVASH